METTASFLGIVFTNGQLDLAPDRRGGCAETSVTTQRQWQLTVSTHKAESCDIYCRYSLDPPGQPDASAGEQRFGLLAKIAASDRRSHTLSFELPLHAHECCYQVVWSPKAGQLSQTSWLELPAA